MSLTSHLILSYITIDCMKENISMYLLGHKGNENISLEVVPSRVLECM